MGTSTLLLLWLGLLGAAPAPQPAAPPLTLAAALRLAEEGSPLLEAIHAETAAATAAAEGARAGRLPAVDLEGAYARSVNPALVFSNKLGQEAFTQSDFAVERLNRPDPLDNWQARLVVTQSLYSGGAVSREMSAARLERDAAHASLERGRQAVVERVTAAYADAVLAARRIDVVERALETARENVRLASDLRDAGLVVDSDLLQARVRESELNELHVRAVNDAEVARAALNLELGRPLATPFTLPRDVSPPPGSDSTLAELVDASRVRPDVIAAQHRVEAARQGIARSRASRRPGVTASGILEANAEDPGDVDGDNWSLLVAARFRVFDGGATAARVREARERHRAADRHLERLRGMAELQVRSAFHALAASRVRVEQATSAETLATESLRIVTDRYREGLTNLVELLDAEAALTRARVRKVAALRDVLVDRTRVDFAAGRL
jgi:outer membrane protein TolC